MRNLVTVEQLEKELKQGTLEPLYLLYGEEIYLLESCLKRMKKIFGQTQVGINEIRIDDTSVSHLISDIETPAFGYEKKLIIARNTGLFQTEGKKKTENPIVQKLLAYLEENENVWKKAVVLIFIEETVNKNALYKWIEKQGKTVEFSYLKPAQMTARLKAIAKAYEVNLPEAVAMYLIETVGCNMQDAMNELRKLIEYTGKGGTIEKKAIDLLCIPQMDSVIFDLTDNLGKKNMQKALEVLQSLLYQKEPMQKILIMLYNHFKKLYFMKIAERENKNAAEVLNLKPNQSFLMGKYKTQASYFKEKELRNLLEALICLDSDAKLGKIDLEIGVEAVLCRYCAA